MEDINGNKIEACQEIGTHNYNILINKLYLVDFKENSDNSGKGSYSNGQFEGLNAIHPTDVIVVSENKNEAKFIEGKTNLKSIITKLLSGLKKYLILFGTMEVKNRMNVQIPIYKDRIRAVEQPFFEPLQIKERIEIPSITIIKMG